MRLFLAAAAALLSAAPAAAAFAHAEPAAAAQQDKAAALAGIVAGSANTVSMGLMLAKQSVLAAMTSQEPDIFTNNPGLSDAVWSAAEPEIRRSLTARYPAFAASVASLYRTRLTARELDGVHTFFSSPTGAKLIRSLSEMIAGAAPGEAPLGPEDEPALKAVSASIALAKFQEVGAECNKLMFAYVTAEDPQAQARVATLVEEALARYADGKGKK